VHEREPSEGVASGRSALPTLRSSRKQGEEGIVQLEGELTADPSLSRLEEWLEEHFVDDGVRTIRIDLSGVHRIDLEGVAALGLLAAESIRNHKVLVVEGATGQVRSKLEETGLLRYLTKKGDPHQGSLGDHPPLHEL
jgi:anti-anti-sigma regulatory factor